MDTNKALACDILVPETMFEVLTYRHNAKQHTNYTTAAVKVNTFISFNYFHLE